MGLNAFCQSFSWLKLICIEPAQMAISAAFLGLSSTGTYSRKNYFDINHFQKVLTTGTLASVYLQWSISPALEVKLDAIDSSIFEQLRRSITCHLLFLLIIYLVYLYRFRGGIHMMRVTTVWYGVHFSLSFLWFRYVATPLLPVSQPTAAFTNAAVDLLFPP